MVNKNILYKIIQAGVFATSADNNQPWKIKLTREGFTLFLDNSFTGKFFDVKNYASLISCGAFLENVALAAQTFGVQTKVIYYNDEPFTDNLLQAIADVRFLPLNEKEIFNFPFKYDDILNRNTNRNLFKKNKEIPLKSLSNIKNLFQKNSGFQMLFYDFKKTRLKKIFYNLERIRFEHKEIYQEFYNAIRWENDSSQAKDGFAVKTLGISNLFIIFLRFLKNWSVICFFNKLGLSRVSAYISVVRPLTYTSMLVSITETQPCSPVAFGHAIERFWIFCNQLGLSLQPLGAAPLLWKRIDLEQGHGLTKNQIKILKSGKDQIFSHSGTSPSSNYSPEHILFFRVGYTDQKPTRSLRRDLNSFIIS